VLLLLLLLLLRLRLPPPLPLPLLLLVVVAVAVVPLVVMVLVLVAVVVLVLVLVAVVPLVVVLLVMVLLPPLTCIAVHDAGVVRGVDLRLQGTGRARAALARRLPGAAAAQPAAAQAADSGRAVVLRARAEQRRAGRVRPSGSLLFT